MNILKAIAILLFAALSTMNHASAASADQTVSITITDNGQALSGLSVTLEIANRGKVSAAPTDADGNTTLALDVANLGKVQVDVYLEDCPNGERRVVIIGPNGDQQTECKLEKIGAFWLTGSQHVLIDIGTKVVTSTGSGASAMSSASGWVPVGVLLGGGVGLTHSSGSSNCGQSSSGSSSNCKVDNSSFAYEGEVGATWEMWRLMAGYFHASALHEKATSGDSTSSSTSDSSFAPSGFYFMAGINLKVGQHFVVIPQAGIASLHGTINQTFTTTFTSGGQSSSESTSLPEVKFSNTAAVYGAAVEWQATENLAVALDYMRMKFSKAGVIDKSLDTVFLRLLYKLPTR